MAAPSVPTNPSLVHDATNVIVTPALTWSAPGATSCRVFLGPHDVPNPGLNASRSGIGILAAGTWTFDVNSGGVPTGGLAPLAYDFTFYWQVTAYNADGATVGPVWRFTTAWVAPATPSGPSPADGATARTFTLSWATAAHAAAYDVKFGTSNPPTTIVSADQTGTSYTVTVTAGVTYYWRIVAKNANANATGPVWSFLAASPATPSSPGPADGEIRPFSSPWSETLTWASTGATTYDVYFGTANPPPLVSTGQAGASYGPVGPLTSTVFYYWKIVAISAAGSTTGPVWRFTAHVYTIAAGPTLAPASGSGLSAGVYQYAFTDVTAVGESLPSPLGTVTIVPQAPNPTLQPFFQLVSAPGTGPFAGPMAGGERQWAYTWVTAGGETLPSPQNAHGAAGSGDYYARFLDTVLPFTPGPGLPLGPTGVTARKIYRTVSGGAQLKLVTTVADNTTTSGAEDHVTDGALGANAPTSNTATWVMSQVAVSAIAVGPAGTTARKLYRTVVGGSQLKLVTTIANNTATTYTDATPDGSLGANAPTTDTSEL